MRFAATTVLLLSSAVAALVRCSDPGLASNPPQLHVGQHVSAETLAPLAPLETSEVEHRLLDRAWVAAGEDALAHPTMVNLPYAESGGFLGSEPSARAFAFEGSEGQVVKIVLARSEAQGSTVFVDGNIRVELFLATDAARRANTRAARRARHERAVIVVPASGGRELRRAVGTGTADRRPVSTVSRARSCAAVSGERPFGRCRRQPVRHAARFRPASSRGHRHFRAALHPRRSRGGRPGDAAGKRARR